MFKKILISIIAVLTLGSTFAFNTATVSASRRTTQAQLEKMEYTGKAKTTKRITAYRIVHTYYTGKAKIIPKGAHIRISSGVGPWNFIITYKGRRYFYQHSTKISTNWFKEI
ncbi:hypothetical protein [uncultured Lactobacillus sp.]|uniref:hypothetical protein n=1 Tax=uncultured Lactobacillus sp. TaxID=153152 RepID=UPI002583EE7E|nr:hypothetical protein [uncultured Lactobacillus sp.]